MRLKVVVHEADEGGLWAEVPAIPGCATEGDTFEELLTNLYEAIEGCLSVDVAHVKTGAHDGPPRPGQKVPEVTKVISTSEVSYHRSTQWRWTI